MKLLQICIPKTGVVTVHVVMLLFAGTGSYPPPAHSGHVTSGEMYDVAAYNRPSAYPSYNDTASWVQNPVADVSHPSPESLATSGKLAAKVEVYYNACNKQFSHPPKYHYFFSITSNKKRISLLI